jgi:hypothetical protein
MRTRFAFGLLIAAAAFGQSPAAVTPYTGEEVAQRTQTLADGSQATETTSSGKVYRDSRGRVRAERLLDPDKQGATLSVEIVDPVAGARYVLDAGNRVAYRSELPRPAKSAAAQSGMASDAPVAMALGLQQMSVEPLGKRMIDGIEASGQRILTTIVPGAESNDRLTVVATEMWVSRQLGVTVASRVVDPRAGVTTYRLGKISLREPDVALFLVPEEYKIVEEGASANLPLN